MLVTFRNQVEHNVPASHEVFFDVLHEGGPIAGCKAMLVLC